MIRMAKEKIADMLKRIRQKKEMLKQLNEGMQRETSTLPTAQRSGKQGLRDLNTKAKGEMKRIRNGEEGQEAYWENYPINAAEFKEKLRKGKRK